MVRNISLDNETENKKITISKQLDNNKVSISKQLDNGKENDGEIHKWKSKQLGNELDNNKTTISKQLDNKEFKKTDQACVFRSNRTAIPIQIDQRLEHGDAVLV